MEGSSSSSSRININLSEKNRRKRAKEFYSNLLSLISPQLSKLSRPDLVDQAINYIKQLQERMKELNLRKELLEEICKSDNVTSGNRSLAEMNIRSFESTLEINLIFGLRKSFILHQAVNVLQEEGAEVTSISYNKVDDWVFYTIYSQALVSRIGIETSRVQERLLKLIS